MTLLASVAGAEPSKDSFRDIQLSKKVRDALAEFKPVSLRKVLVRVQDRVVILEGEVGSEEILHEAAKRVARVPGIAEVRVDLVKVIAVKEEDPLTIPLVPDEPPTKTEARSQPRFTSAVAMPTALPHPEPSPEVVGVRLDPPIPIPPLSATVLGPVVPPAPSFPRRTPGQAEDMVSATVERARQGNPRYQALTVEVRGNLVWLRGNADQLDSGMALAQTLTDMGVKHVVVQCNNGTGR